MLRDICNILHYKFAKWETQDDKADFPSRVGSLLSFYSERDTCSQVIHAKVCALRIPIQKRTCGYQRSTHMKNVLYAKAFTCQYRYITPSCLRKKSNFYKSILNENHLIISSKSVSLFYSIFYAVFLLVSIHSVKIRIVSFSSFV